MNQQLSKDKIKNKWYNKLWITMNFVWLINSLYECYFDIKSFLRFRKQMKGFAKDNLSPFVKNYKLKLNWLGNIVYTHKIMDIDRVLYFDERMKNNYLVDVTSPEHEFLFTELGWHEYLLTNFIEFTDEEGNQSSYYGVEFRFTPLALTNTRIWKFLLFYLALFGIILWLCRHWIIFGCVWLFTALTA